MGTQKPETMYPTTYKVQTPLHNIHDLSVQSASLKSWLLKIPHVPCSVAKLSYLSFQMPLAFSILPSFHHIHFIQNSKTHLQYLPPFNPLLLCSFAFPPPLSPSLPPFLPSIKNYLSKHFNDRNYTR